jgi:hypothetical protein
VPRRPNSEDKPVEIELNGFAQIILASLLGMAAVLKALAIFLPVWRDKEHRAKRLKAEPDGQLPPAHSSRSIASRSRPA